MQRSTSRQRQNTVMFRTAHTRPSCLMLALALCMAIASLVAPAQAANCLRSTTATVTLLGPAANSSVCNQTASSLNANQRLRANNVVYMRAWRCNSCTPLRTNGTNGTSVCLANITATLKPLALVQLYANAWAVPDAGVYVTRNLLRNIVSSNPTCNSTAGCQDLFPQALHDIMGAGCQAVTTYIDSCGGRATSPYNCSAAPNATTPTTPTPTKRASPPPSPPPSPSPGCTLYIAGGMNNASRCPGLLARMNSDPDFVAGLSSLPVVTSDTGCICRDARYPNGCSVGFTGKFASRADLLQFYANVGAYPHDRDTMTPIPLPLSQSTLPWYPGLDYFSSTSSIIVRTLGFVCGAQISYSDTCGGVGIMPMHGDCWDFPPPPPRPPRPARSPIFNPVPVSPPCQLTIRAVATSQTKCRDFLIRLWQNQDYRDGLSIQPSFYGCECDADASGNCRTTITGSFSSRNDLLQFYANVGAWPSNNVTYEPLSLPPSRSSLPNAPGIDLFQALGGHVMEALGFVCGQSVEYSDTCGGVGTQPMHGDCYSPPSPPLPSSPRAMGALNNDAACELTINGPTTALPACREYMRELAKNTSYAAGLDVAPAFEGCGACRSGTEAQGTCLVSITGRFSSHSDLLQFYSNAGALPVSLPSRAPISLPPTMSSLPNSPSYDLFSGLSAIEGLGGGCGSAVTYSDSCGGTSDQGLVVECAGFGR